MFLITFFFFICIFLVLAMLSGVIINHTMENRIKKILKKYNYTLISIENTHRTFKYKRSQNLSWKDLLGFGYSTSKIIIFKEVSFSTIDNKKITSLVAMEHLLPVYNKVFFEINLETLVPIKVV